MSQRATRAKKLGATLLVSTVAASLSPLFAGMAAAAPPAAPSIAAVCVNTDDENDFTDLGASSGEALDAINCLTDLGLVNGTGDGTTFSPTQSLTRQQGAALIARIADAKNANDAAGGVTLVDVPATGPDQFTDDEGSTLEDSINRLAAVDIIEGKTATLFDPTAPLTRGQFASLIDRMETYLVGGTSPWTTTTDYFTDDTGSVHEAAINRVAEQGILRGDGNVTSGVNDPISRTQAALVIARVLAVNLADGLITAPARPGQSNETITITPTDDVVLPHTSQRQYTVSGLAAGNYRVTLVNCDNITETDGTTTFAEDANTGLADAGTVDARISVVNGADVADAQSVGAIAAPANGTITFTVISDGTTECFAPVVYTDQGGANTRLNIDDEGAPTEPFGVGGSTTFVPTEATEGDSIDDLVTDVFDGGAVTLNSGSIFFADDDNFRIENANGFCIEVTEAVFLQNLSEGDVISTVLDNTSGDLAPYDQDGGNTFCLFDAEPGGPTDVSADVNPLDPDNSVIVTFTPETNIDDQNVYQAVQPVGVDCEDIPFADYDPATTAAPVTAATTSVTVTGLAPDEEYCFLVTSVSGADESGVTAGSTDEQETALLVDQATITSAVLTTDTVIEGIADEDDVFTLVVSESLDDATDNIAGATISVTDADGDTALLNCGPTTPADLTDTEVSCVIDDGATATVTDDTITVTFLEDAFDRNAAGDDDFEYPLTITAITGITDDDDGVPINVAGSADKVIG